MLYLGCQISGHFLYLFLDWYIKMNEEKAFFAVLIFIIVTVDSGPVGHFLGIGMTEFLLRTILAALFVIIYLLLSKRK